MPHDQVTDEEIQLVNRREVLGREIAALTETYENLLLEATEEILKSLAEDSKAVKRLTFWLVVLTAVLSIGTIIDVLTRLGLM